jgi:hypothetical protein
MSLILIWPTFSSHSVSSLRSIRHRNVNMTPSCLKTSVESCHSHPRKHGWPAPLALSVIKDLKHRALNPGTPSPTVGKSKQNGSSSVCLFFCDVTARLDRPRGYLQIASPGESRQTATLLGTRKSNLGQYRKVPSPPRRELPRSRGDGGADLFASKVMLYLIRASRKHALKLFIEEAECRFAVGCMEFIEYIKWGSHVTINIRL